MYHCCGGSGRYLTRCGTKVRRQQQQHSLTCFITSHVWSVCLPALSDINPLCSGSWCCWGWGSEHGGEVMTVPIGDTGQLATLFLLLSTAFNVAPWRKSTWTWCCICKETHSTWVADHHRHIINIAGKEALTNCTDHHRHHLHHHHHHQYAVPLSFIIAPVPIGSTLTALQFEFGAILPKQKVQAKVFAHLWNALSGKVWSTAGHSEMIVHILQCEEEEKELPTLHSKCQVCGLLFIIFFAPLII